MGIANTFTFGEIDTEDYGLVIEGPGDYSAPKRAVETISIPGRNGAFQLDKGYYENIEIEYNVVVKDSTQSDFKDSIEAFRNAIASQIGYQRLEDTYHPGEYRMAMYSGGFDEDPQFHGKGAIFKVKFDCKPQRYLKSGEDAISVDSGDVVSNPTLFASSPMLEVEGYGTIGFNGFQIEIDRGDLGEVELYNSYKTDYGSVQLNSNIQTLNNGDTITLRNLVAGSRLTANINYKVLSATVTSESGVGNNLTKVLRVTSSGSEADLSTVFPDLTFQKGTPSSYTQTIQATCSAQRIGGGSALSDSTTITISVSYDGTDEISMTFEHSPSSNTYITVLKDRVNISTKWGTIVGYSTQPLLGHPTYIDCDLGEAYKEVGGSIVSLNRYIDLGSDLPKLASGANTITFDNTITDLQVVPRWWKI